MRDNGFPTKCCVDRLKSQSLADLKANISSMSASGRKADIGVLQSHVFVGPFVSQPNAFQEMSMNQNIRENFGGEGGIDSYRLKAILTPTGRS